MKLFTYIFISLLSTQVLAVHQCEGTYKLAKNSSEKCLQIITVQHKLIEYNFEALVIETPELTDKEELIIEDMLSENVLASDLTMTSNQGLHIQGGFWGNGGYYTPVDTKQNLRFDRVTTCDRKKLKIITRYSRDHSFFSGEGPAQTCNYLKLK